MAARRRLKKTFRNAHGDNRVTAPGGVGVTATKCSPLVDTPVQLLKDIAARRVDPKGLTKTQRQAVLMVLANGKQTSPELGELLGVSASTIRNDLKQIRATLGREVRDFSLEEVLGDMHHSAEKFSTMAVKNSDPGLAWTIKRDFWRLLKEFGVIGPKEDKTTLTLTLQSIGDGYERVRKIIGQPLDPALTGEVVEASFKSEEEQAKDSLLTVPALPFSQKSPATPEEEE